MSLAIVPLGIVHLLLNLLVRLLDYYTTWHVTPKILLATPRGFEPLISTVTGWHVSPLHHGAILVQWVGLVISPWCLFRVYQGTGHCVKLAINRFHSGMARAYLGLFVLLRQKTEMRPELSRTIEESPVLWLLS